jgi:uncharacterized protein YukE
MNRLGADVEALQRLATALQRKAEQIDRLTQTFDRAVANTSWTGPDADAFRSKWNGELKSELTRARRLLADASAASEIDRRRQIQASR